MATELTDVRVDTMGLVRKGANGEAFFLRKADKDTGMLNKILAAVRSAFSEAEPADDKADMSEKPKPEVKKEMTEEVEKAVKTPEELKAEEDAKAEAAKKLEDSKKAEMKKDDEVKAIEKSASDRISELEKSLSELKVSLEKTNDRAVAAETAVVEKTYLEKSAEFGDLPVSREDLAKNFASLEKADKGTADFFYALLKSVSKIAKDSKVFGEVGTSVIEKSVEDKTEIAIKEGKMEDVRKILLDLTPDEQKELINARHQSIKGGK